MIACALLHGRILKAGWLAVITLLCGVPGTFATAAARLVYALETSVVYDDNVHLTDSARDSDEILIPRLLFSFTDDSTKLKANVAGDFSYYHYLRGTFSDDFRGTLAGTARRIAIRVARYATNR